MLRAQVTELRQDEELTYQQAEDLRLQLRREFDGFTDEWQHVLGRMRAADREEAIPPATMRWDYLRQDLENCIHLTIVARDALEDGVAPASPAPSLHPPAPPEGAVEMAEEATEEDSNVPSPRGHPHVPMPVGSLPGSSPPPPYPGNDGGMRRELDDMRRQLQAQQRLVHRERREAWERQQRLERQGQRREAQLREVQQQLQQARLQRQADTSPDARGRRPRRTSENDASRSSRPVLSARQRLHRPLSSPPSAGPLARRPTQPPPAMPPDSSRASFSHVESNAEFSPRALFRHPPPPRRDHPPPPRREEGRRHAGGHGRFDQYLHLAPPPPLNPFAFTLQDEDDDYYKRCFPYPFNIPPPPDAHRVTEFKKLEGVVQPFSGHRDEFQAWMATFIPVVHHAKCPVSWKAAALNKSLKGDDPRLRSILAGAGATKEDYARVISRLVRAYVHPQGLLAGRAEALRAVRNITMQDHLQLEDWLNKLESYMDTAAAVGCHQEIFSAQLYEDNLGKMEENMACAFLDWANYRELPLHVVTLAGWLDQRLRQLQAVARGRQRQEVQQVYTGAQPRFVPRERSPTRQQQQQLRPQRPVSCPLDGENHYLQACHIFRALRPEERREKLRDLRRCYACLAPGHNISRCIKAIRCEQCAKRHNTLLHGSRPRMANTALYTTGAEQADDSWSEDSAEEVVQGAETVYTTKSATTTVALQTIPLEVFNQGRKITINCLIDSGATGAFISKKAAEALQLTGRSAMVAITGFGGRITKEMVMMTEVAVSQKGVKKRHKVQVQVSNNPAALYTPFDWTTVQQRFRHLKKLPLQPPVQGEGVDLLLGMGAPDLVRSLVPDVIGSATHHPIARLTKLGWVVGGPTGHQMTDQQRVSFAFNTTPWVPPKWEGQNSWFSYTFSVGPIDARHPPRLTRTKDEDLVQLVARMWEIDKAGGKTPAQVQDDVIFEYLRHNLTLKEGKYELPTLWNEKKRELGNNYRYALTRLTSLLSSKQFKMDQVKSLYMEQIQLLIKNGYAELISTSTPEEDDAYYLPHFAVIRWDKITTQVRLVMDGAAKYARKLSLNDCLKKGPKLVNDLPIVLLRFRQKRYCLAADIKKMFFQIRLAREDRDYHRFLWQSDEGVKIYRWTVHPFGSAASLCIAIFTIKEHASRHKQDYPQAAETVINSTLVDDNLDSCDTEEQAVQLGLQLRQLYEKAGMQLGKIISNSDKVIRSFPPEMVANTIQVSEFHTTDLPSPVIKTLGIVYLAEEDAFTFRMQPPETEVWSKRNVLRYVATLYDAHGLVAPHVVVARIILQDVWRDGKQWDEEIDGTLLTRWKQWLKKTPCLKELRIPRQLAVNPDVGPRLHVFCDASADAYASAAYYTTGGEARLAIAKARVAPLKALSIPRLEMMGAELATETAAVVLKAFPIQDSDVFFWTDSRNVLSWVHSESRTLTTFIGNRVTRVLEASKVWQWRWVPSLQNPADIPSRGMTAEKLAKSELWWKGPRFIVLEESHWPQQPQQHVVTQEGEEEIRREATFLQHPLPTDKYNATLDKWKTIATNNWGKIVGIFSFMLKWRFPHDTRRQLEEKATTKIYLAMQQSSFAYTIQLLADPPPAWTRSTMAKLKPFIDTQGVIRSRGRLQMSHLSYQQKYLVLLPRDHPWTTALIFTTHRRLLHQGTQHVLYELRRKVWITRGTTKIRQLLRDCTDCKRRKAAPQPQAMAPVIEARLPPSRCLPFTVTAIDMAGPFYIKDVRDVHVENKAFFILFTCATFRAVHLEPVYNAAAQAFLHALQRFIARRGKPQTIRADNGSNFLAAEHILQKLWKQVAPEMQKNNPTIEWQFNPPRAPHTGGLFESMVKATKRALYHVYKPNHKVTFEAFTTALAVVEGILNSRPLSYHTAEIESNPAITPAHFLSCAPFRQLAEAPERGWKVTTAWQKLQLDLDSYWRQFCQEMRHTLQHQSKWLAERQDVAVGDVVVVLDKKQRGVWPLGKITATENSRDNVVRRVNVLTEGRNVRRAINSVILLQKGPEKQEARVQAHHL